MRWKPSREEIKDWVSEKEDAFHMRPKTVNMYINLEWWKQRYIYINLHETLFIEFPCLLHEWIKGKT
jgi:hypothetical protein